MGEDGLGGFVPDTRRMRLAKALVKEIARQEGRNLLAAAVFGSVAYGGERRHSDVDLLLVVRRKTGRPWARRRRGFLVTVSEKTPAEVREEVLGADPRLPEILSGWRGMRPLHDPTRLLRRLIARSRRVPASQFRRAAREGLYGSYEDLGKLRDAIEARDRRKMREMAIWFTGGAALILFCLERHAVSTGAELFVEVQERGATGRAIASLRYGNPSVAVTSRLAEGIWADLRRRARRQAIRVDALV